MKWIKKYNLWSSHLYHQLLYNYIPKETVDCDAVLVDVSSNSGNSSSNKGCGDNISESSTTIERLFLEIDGGVLIQTGLFRSTIIASIVVIFSP